MNNRKQQILAFFIGVFTIVLIFEIFLRIIGTISQKSRETADNVIAGRQKDDFVILCLGNSYTLGIGAPAGSSYPDQLQRMFDKADTGRKVIVINRGVGCENTIELLSKLGNNINNIKPDIIVLQTGQVNGVNFCRYTEYLNRISSGELSLRRVGYFLNDLFSKIRTYKLLSLLVINVQTKNKSKKPLASYFRREIGQSDAELAIRSYDKNFFADEKKVKAAIKLFKKGIEESPAYPNSYAFIGRIYLYQNRYDKALEWFIKAVMSNPDFRKGKDVGEDNHGYQLIREMRMMAVAYHEERIVSKIDKFIAEFNRRYPENAENFFSLSRDNISSWVESDISEMVRIIRDRGIKIILQNYPLCPISQDCQYYNDAIGEVAVRLGVPLVDNGKIFKEVIDRGGKFEDYFISDGHCNSGGYRLMAANVYNKIIEEKILNVNKQR
ncbi:MAG: hypothetical protein PHO40_00605 [Candidatus Omnitrophica bacterium]|jgi:tetratricopeptide (TPR) repeat protein|nr:hypothetical protein [Candidatus Omnitrophota bacterium]